MARAPKSYSDIDITAMSKIEMSKLYKQLIRTANKRIATISKEKYRSQAQAYKYNVEAMAGADYIKVNKGIASFAGLGRKATINQLREATAKVLGFLNAKTSTVAGIKEVENFRIKQIQEVYKNFRSPEYPSGIDAKTAKEIAIFLGSEEGKLAKEIHDSDDIIVALALSNKVSKGAQSIMDAFIQFKERGISWAKWQQENESTLYNMEDF